MASERRVLSSLELLPEECQDDVVWALARLNERERTQQDILFELNTRLAVKGYGPISKSAFSRRSVRLKRRKDRLAERDHLYAGIRETITAEKMADQDVVLGELLKALVDEMIDDAASAKDVKELANAYRHVVGAQQASAKLRAAAQAEADRKIAKAIDAVAVVADEAGLSAERIAQLRRDFLGVRPKAQKDGDA